MVPRAIISITLSITLASLLTFGAAGSGAGADFQGFQFAGRLSHDVGGVGVRGTRDGFGGGVSARMAFGGRRTSWELSGDLDVAGYAASGDGDPIFQAALTVHRKAYRGHELLPIRAWWSAGAGVGALGLGASGVVVPVRVAVGLSLGRGRWVGLEVALFERFSLAVTGGSSASGFINSAGIEVALRMGR